MKTLLQIFYVDDDYDDRKFFKIVAESLGHQVTLFKNGFDLLETLRIKQPDVIFMDIYMPSVSGVEMLTFLKGSTTFRDIPVVMLSAIYPERLVSRFFMAGANYLLKKSSAPEYKNAIERVLQIDLRCPIILN